MRISFGAALALAGAFTMSTVHAQGNVFARDPASVAQSRGALSPGCITTLPDSPQADAVAQYATGDIHLWRIGYATSYKIWYWRQPCADNPQKSVVLLRYSFNGGKVPVCANGMRAVQNGTSYPSIVLRSSPASATGYCATISTEQTFILDQVSNVPNFDEQQAFSVEIERDSYYSVDTVNVPPYQTGSSGTLVNPTAGWWWNPAEAGRGFGISSNGNDRIYLGGFYYLASAGASATWAVGTLFRASGSNSFTGGIFYCSGGQALESPITVAPNCTWGGDATFTFSDSRKGQLVITRPNGVTTISLVPFESF